MCYMYFLHSHSPTSWAHRTLVRGRKQQPNVKCSGGSLTLPVHAACCLDAQIIQLAAIVLLIKMQNLAPMVWVQSTNRADQVKVVSGSDVTMSLNYNILIVLLGPVKVLTFQTSAIEKFFRAFQFSTHWRTRNVFIVDTDKIFSYELFKFAL